MWFTVETIAEVMLALALSGAAIFIVMGGLA